MPSSASLLLAHKPQGKTLLLVGDGKLVHTRIHAAREAGMQVHVVWHTRPTSLAQDIPFSPIAASLLFPPTDAEASAKDWGQLLDQMDGDTHALFAVCVTDTLATLADEAPARRRRCDQLAEACRARRIPINVTDVPDLCDFSFPATHRFRGTDDDHMSSLQIAVTTNGHGCRLAGRLRRHIVSSLPASVGLAVERIGTMRELAKAEAAMQDAEHEEEPSVATSLGYTDATSKQRERMRWVAQISEYWPLETLAALEPLQMQSLLASHTHEPSLSTDEQAEQRAAKRSRHALAVQPTRAGHVYLLGSGPGHPGLLTVAAREILTSPDTDLILSDKLVPTAVLALIPKTTPLVIAKKFPGNAEGAQSELIVQALEAAQQGKTVVRLKQGDPFVYGRGGEELVACQNAGIDCTVVPGISSALAGPLLFGIPVTQRGAAESMMLCTGVGRDGRQVQLPGYERSRTLVLLMGVARLAAVVETLVAPSNTGRAGTAYPPYTPIAIIERASSPDQRMIASTLEQIVDVMEHRIPDGQRPPAMMVIGWAVLSLAGEQAGAHILDDAAACEADASTDALLTKDQARIATWLGERGYRIQEGLPLGYRRFGSSTGLPLTADDATPAPRSSTGWAAPRYGTDGDATLVGGWTAGEKDAPPTDVVT